MIKPFRSFVLFINLFLIITACEKTNSGTEPADDTTDSEFRLLWTDSFDARHQRWNAASWTFGNNACEFSEDMVSYADGQLQLQMAKKGSDRGSYTAKPYWGAEYYTGEKYRYGRLDVQMKPNSPPGVVTSFFLLDIVNDINGQLQDHFEIDIEFPGSTTKVSYALHYFRNGEMKSVVKEVPLEFDASEAFHLYSIEWKPDSIRFFIDGEKSAVFEIPVVMSELRHPMSIHMNYWVSQAPGWVGAFDERVLPLTTFYEYVSYSRYIDPILPTQ